MKLKALHHSILVKAEFFMKQELKSCFPKNFVRNGLPVIYVVSFAKAKLRKDEIKKQNAKRRKAKGGSVKASG